MINTDIPSDQTINLNQGVAIGSLTVGDINGSGAYTLAANDGALTFDNGPSPAMLTRLAASRSPKSKVQGPKAEGRCVA